MNCGEIERIVWTDGPDAAPESHLLECQSCRDEARRAGDLQAALVGMRNRFALPPADLEEMIVAVVTRTRLTWARDIVAHPKFWRGAAVGAAAAAGVAGAVLAARRRGTTRAEVA
jgi:predicted anti-sigma-YlaC factor YlaD